MMKDKKKFNFNNLLPLLLFVVILINYIPLFYLNYNTKNEVAVPMDTLVITMGIECVLLFVFYIKKTKITKEMVINFILMTIIFGIQGYIQYVNYKNGTNVFMEVANIATKCANIFLLYIMLLDFRLKESSIKVFMNLLIAVGIVACLHNMWLYKSDILFNLGLQENVKAAFAAKGFFAQKNMFAMYLYGAFIAIIYLFNDKNKWYYNIYLGLAFLLFMFNLVFTFSRTGTAVILIFLAIWFLCTNKIKIIPKILLLVLIGGIAYGGYNYLETNNPELIDKLIRSSSIKTFTGRTTFWEIAEEELSSTPQKTWFGIGRFQGEELIKKYGVNQYHNTYIDFLISGGIVELVYLLSLYIVTFVKVVRSKMDYNYKVIYFSMYASLAVYMLFESFGRFSIGCSDTLCLIVCLSIPLIHANCSKDASVIMDEEREQFEENIKVEKKPRIVRRNIKNPGKRAKMDENEKIID